MRKHPALAYRQWYLKVLCRPSNDMSTKSPRDAVNIRGRERKGNSDMTDSTQQDRAASIPDAAIEVAANPILANNLDHVRKFLDWKVGDPVD